MSNVGISISFVIGGILLMSILTLNASVMENSGETVLDMQTKQTVESVTQIMRRDFQRLGYNMPESAPIAIESFTDKKIVFWADNDDNINTKAKKITWELTGNQAESTQNPQDYQLVRSESSGSIIYFPVTEFSFSYRDKNGNKVNQGSDPASKIRSINVQLQTESADHFGDEQYSTSFWEKRFSPPNLRLRDIEW